MSRPPLGERAPRAGGSKAGSKAGGAGEGGGERGPQIDRPEVHFVGEIVSGCGFGPGVSCRWRVVFGESWELMGADASRFGQTHWDYPKNDEGDVCAWGHPLDLHLQTTNVEQGWPRLILKVMKMDDWERIEVVAYGQASLPTTSGSHRIEVNTWRPMGSDFEEAQAFFVGGVPRLRKDGPVYETATEDRNKMTTKSMGKITVDVSVMTRHFSDISIDGVR